MSEYRSKWMDWKSPHTPPYFTDRTDKRGVKRFSVALPKLTKAKNDRFHTIAPLGEPNPDEPDCDDSIEGKRIVEAAGRFRR